MNDYGLKLWLEKLDEISHQSHNDDKVKAKTPSNKKIVYVLSQNSYIEPYSLQVKKNGESYLSENSLNIQSLLSRFPDYLTNNDLGTLTILDKLDRNLKAYGKKICSDLLKNTLESGT